MAYAIIACKEGGYRAVRSRTTRKVKYKAMSRAELAKAQAEDDGKEALRVRTM
jgi:hypothetical protein